MKGGGARRRALEVLLAVADGAALADELDAALARTHDPREAAFLVELVRGTLQWQARYDFVIARFSRKRAPTDPVLLSILRLSLHQLLGQDGVPPYAAIHQAGELCRIRAGRARVGYVNGLLQAARRRLRPEGATVAAREAALRALFADLETDRPRWLAAWHSLPQWLVTRWLDRFGEEAAARICAATNTPAPLHLHVLGGSAPADVAAGLVSAGLEARVGPGPAALTLADRPARRRLAETLADHPELIVQDATVQAATAWLAAGAWPGGPVLDLCAAPGGKTAHLAAIRPHDGPLVAMDHRPERVTLLQRTLARTCGGRVPVVRADGTHPPFAAGSFGAILLDGPCSGTGVLRHHPDGRWRLQAGTPARKGATLLALGRAAAELLRPGGRLLYATCSLESEENGDVVGQLRAACPDLEPDPGQDGAWQRLWLPGDPETPAGGDGFYAARLVRRGGAARGTGTEA